MEAEPLKDGITNPNGVFARYYGASTGAGKASPVTFEIAVTNYTSIERLRERYLLGKGGPNATEKEIRDIKVRILHRKRVAVEMEEDIKKTLLLMGTAAAGNYLLPEALSELRFYADRYHITNYEREYSQPDQQIDYIPAFN